MTQFLKKSFLLSFFALIELSHLMNDWEHFQVFSSLTSKFSQVFIKRASLMSVSPNDLS